MAHSEHRRFPRAQFGGSVAVCRQRQAQVVTPEDISAGGVLLTLADTPNPQAVLTLHITLPGLRRGFTVLGRVRRVLPDQRRAAVEFLDILPSWRAMLNHYVHQQHPTAHAV